MNTKAINSKLLARMKDKKYRDLFIAAQLNKIIPFQIRALRAARNNMTQAELAERAETKQSVISRIQSKGASNLNIKSLLKLASAFDVALVVRFEPIDRFIDWVDDLSPEVMSPKPSDEVIAEIERKALEPAEAEEPETEAAPAASSVVIDAVHLFPAVSGNSTTTQMQFLPFTKPVRVSTSDTPRTEVERLKSGVTQTALTPSASQQSARKVAGGSNGRNR